MAVLSFFHIGWGSKISTMKFPHFFLFIFFSTLLCADNQTAEEILLKTFHRMDGINYSFKLDSKSNGKKKKEKHFQAYVHWPSEGDILCQFRIKSIETKRKKPASFWEHRFRDGTKAKKWMSRPVTGKLKDVSDKHAIKKDFSFSDLVVTEKDIRSHAHQLLPQEKVDKFSAYVIESIEKRKEGKVKESKKLWIESDSYMVLKVEFYTGSGRLYRSVECSNIQSSFNTPYREILFPMSIYVQDLKSKSDIQVTIKDIELNPEFDMDLFIPKDQ